MPFFYVCKYCISVASGCLRFLLALVEANGAATSTPSAALPIAVLPR